MAENKLDVKFEKPPIHVTSNGSLYVESSDIIQSKLGQDLILKMATVKPLRNQRQTHKDTDSANGEE